MPNVFGIADNILVIGYDKDGADHDKAVYNVLRWCQDVNLKLKKRQVSFQVHIRTILWQSSIKRRHPTRSTKDQSTDPNAGAMEQKGAAGLPRHNYLSWQILPRYSRGMQTTTKANFKQDNMDMECIIPGTVR